MIALKKFFREVAIIIATAAICGGAVWAGSLTPSASPAATGYTLEDIYNRLNTNAEATAGNHSFSPSGSPAGSMYSLTQIYEKIPAIDGSKILAGTSYLGVDGAIAVKDSVVGDNGQLAISLPDGYYAGKTCTATDSNLLAANIKSGEAIFCTIGSLLPSGGTAIAGNVLSGATFFGASQSDWNLQTGTMTNVGAQIITPSTSNQAITAGYHSGAGYCAGDSDLISGNIKSGVNLFGVEGASSVVDTSTGDAIAADILSGKIAWVNGSQITGNAAAGDNVNGTNGQLAIIIPDGLYLGSKTCTASDTNLLAANIASGTTIFGVTGTMAGRSLLPDTGQAKCYNVAGSEITCGTSLDGQDAQYTSVNSAVCDRAASGTDASFADNADGTITDNCTNLMWKKCSEGLSGATCGTGSASTMTWENGLALCEATALCNDNTFAADGDCSENGGVKYNDWRLPNINELLSIVNYSTYSPSINTTYFPATVSNGYWTSTTYAYDTSNAWNVYFYFGSTYGDNKTSSYRVRCVRG